MNRIDAAFNELNENGRKGLFPFIVAGHPDLETTIRLIARFQELGASGIELGFPFTDPVADGPVIQTAFNHALDAGVTVEKIFDAFGKARDRIRIPLLAMVSVSIVFRIGVDAFLDRAGEAGFSGLIIPDLSLEEAATVKEKAEARDLRLAMLVSPTSPTGRQDRIAKTASGFIYYMSVAGVTGERTKLPPELADNVRRLKDVSGMPVLVGFGIKDPDQVRQVCSVADGAIVGSAFVRRITDAVAAGAPSEHVVDQLSLYLNDLLSGLPDA